MYFDGLLEFPDDKPIVNLRIYWHGAIAKVLEISTDMVPAIHKTNWHPKDVTVDDSLISSDIIDEIGYFLLFHVPREYSSDELTYVRVSSAPLEIKVLQSVPVVFRESYALSKALKSHHFSPHIQFSDEEDSESEDEKEKSKTKNRRKINQVVIRFKRITPLENHTPYMITKVLKYLNLTCLTTRVWNSSNRGPVGLLL